ncbi:MAG TPA: hypothetical protein VK083_18985 [Nocardia sp.]|uniref:hypothetical protein n=1 Tax=Nocardia TaxID=1817 RepID=UPI002456707A|nr:MULTISPECIES: hypothetical protein [Nocardia]HLS78870.1 hypothetical protein [Nocardia sp.]
MAIQVVEASMITSDDTSHMARCVGGDLWVVSWLPGRTLTGPQAVAAMTIAAAVATQPMDTPAQWSTLDPLALRVGLTGRQSVHLVRLENHDLRRAGDASRVTVD